MMNKLPENFQKNDMMCQMAKMFENKKIIFASSVMCENGKYKVIKKTSGKPVFDKDRPIYSMLRGMSKTIITSGKTFVDLDNNLKAEKDTFKVHFARGDKDIEKMYDAMREKQKQNVFVMTDMKKEDINNYINSDLYNLCGPECLKKHEGKITLNEVLCDMCDQKMSPILIECGPTIMNEYWSKCKKTNDPCHIDMMYLACFEGKMKNECVGDELMFDQGCYKKVYESEKMDVKDDMDNQGKLCFKVYQFNKQS